MIIGIYKNSKKFLTIYKNYDIVKLLLDVFVLIMKHSYAVRTVRRYVPVAQWTESKFPKLLVAGSSPAESTIYQGGIPKSG